MAEMTKNKSEKIKTAPGVVQHHEIGELAHFLSVFGKNKDQAVKSLLASSLQIVGFDELKEKYHTRWDAVKKRVDVSIEAFFTKKLSKHDLFLRLSESSFALVFANTTAEEGLARANKLGQELLQLLFGEMPEASMISVKAMIIDDELVDFIDDFQNLDELVEYLQGASDPVIPETVQLFKEEEPSLSVSYRPMINHAKKIMSVMEAIPCRSDNGKWKTLEPSDAVLTGTAFLRAELDFKVLKDTEFALKQLGTTGKKPIVMVPVDFETVAHAYRRLNYASILKTLPEFSQRHLVISIGSIKAGLLNSRLRQILTTLNPLVLGFIFEIEEGWDDFHIISDLPVYGVRFKATTEQDLLWVEKLVQKARAAKVRTCWRDLDNDFLARRAFEIGVDYVSGPIMGAIQQEPIMPFSLRGALKK